MAKAKSESVVKGSVVKTADGVSRRKKVAVKPGSLEIKTKASTKATKAKTKTSRSRQMLPSVQSDADRRSREKQQALVLQGLYKDHRNMEKALGAFEDQLGFYKQDKPANFKLMYDVMTYMVQAPDQYHHPLEEKMFALLANKDDDLLTRVTQTTAEHKLIKDEGEAVLKCIEEQIKSPGKFKETYIIDNCEKYISHLRYHMKDEEAHLFREGIKLLTEKEWRSLALSMNRHPDDPLFADGADNSFDNLRSYFRHRVDAIVEKYSEQQYIHVDHLKEGVATLSASVSDISSVVGSNSKQAISETFASYGELLKTRPKKITPWLVTPLSCALNGFDAYVKTVTEVAVILHRTYDDLVGDGLAKPRSVEELHVNH